MSDKEPETMLETLLVAQVLTLAEVIKQNSKTWKSSYIPDAVKTITEHREEVLKLLYQTR